jgi:hypothetical protein
LIDQISKYEYKGNLENINKSLITCAKMKFDYENYSRFNSRGLIYCLETGISNFYFRECKAPMTDGLARFYGKSRAGIQFTPKRKKEYVDEDKLRNVVISADSESSDEKSGSSPTFRLVITS